MVAGRVFISHCVKDHSDVQDLLHYLEARDISVWIAPRDVRPGLDYSEQLQEAIEQCSAFVVIVTEAANASLFVRAETEMAFSSRRPIFPVRFGDIEPAKGLRLFLNIHHWTNAFGAESPQNLRQLASGLAALSCAAVGPAPAAPAVALEGPNMAPPPDEPPREADLEASDPPAISQRAPLLTRPRAAMAGAAALLLSLSLAWPLVTNSGRAASVVERPASRGSVPNPGGIANGAAEPVAGPKPAPRAGAHAAARRPPAPTSAGTRSAAAGRTAANRMAASSTRRAMRIPASTRPVSPPRVRIQMPCRQVTVSSGAASDRHRACVSAGGNVLMM